MKKHIYILHFEFLNESWSSLVASSLCEIPDEYIKNLCEDILENCRKDFVDISSSPEKIGYKISIEKFNHIVDVSKHAQKSYSFQYLGFMNIHKLDYNIINIEQDDKEIGTRLIKAYQGSLS